MPDPTEHREPGAPSLADLPLFDSHTGELTPVRTPPAGPPPAIAPPSEQPLLRRRRVLREQAAALAGPSPASNARPAATQAAPGLAAPPSASPRRAPTPDVLGHPGPTTVPRALAPATPQHPSDAATPQRPPDPPTPLGLTAPQRPSDAATPQRPLDPATRPLRPDAASPATPDWALVRSLRRQATDLLARRSDGTVDSDAQRELGRELVGRLVEETVTEAMHLGQPGLTPRAQHELAVAVFDAMFGLGRLQPLVDDPSVENIEVFGDRVRVVHDGGQVSTADPIADSDDDLVEYLRFLADRAGRPFSPANPSLHLQLPGGSRLAATAWISPRPAVVIRKHRLVEITLPDLERTGMFDGQLSRFLAAAVRARLSVVVSGAQGSGKTTLVRALAGEIEGEHIGTAETELELFLHELPRLLSRGSRVTAWEARPGNGERSPDGRVAGEVTLNDIVYDSMRFNLSRLIVGEVRGAEVLAMFKAMQAGAGSLSTTHAYSARGAIDRLVTCAMEAGARVTEQFAYRQVADHLRLVVQLQFRQRPDGRRERFVSEVLAIEGIGENGRPSVTDVFVPGPTGHARPGVLPTPLAEQLAPHGYQFGDEPASPPAAGVASG